MLRPHPADCNAGSKARESWEAWDDLSARDRDEIEVFLIRLIAGSRSARMSAAGGSGHSIIASPGERSGSGVTVRVFEKLP